MLKIALLPLYLKLYDESPYEKRFRLEPFYDICVEKLSVAGANIIKSKFCRVEQEFKDAIEHFKKEDADVIVTLHMAYSPSLECINALRDAGLPIVVLDTTETFYFGFDQDPGEISFNHGIHGVMDMCNMLKRHNIPYTVCAGHWEESGLFERVVSYCKAAKAASSFNGLRVGRIGEPFNGMGDFYVEDSKLKKDLGVTVIPYNNEKYDVSNEDIEQEIQEDLNKYDLSGLSDDVYRLSVKTCLEYRRWIEYNKLDAFTFNFLAIQTGTLPYMEASKGMARGLGYAGEGDTLTASLAAVLQKGFGAASFVEIFCPDWDGNTLFLSHMGEMNINLADPESITCSEMDFPYTTAENPAVLYGRFRAGKAVYVNLLPLSTGYGLFIANVEMISNKNDTFKGSVRGWMKPDMPIARFLEEHSNAGATHHSALVYDADIDALRFFGEIMGFKVTVLD